MFSLFLTDRCASTSKSEKMKEEEIKMASKRKTSSATTSKARKIEDESGKEPEEGQCRSNQRDPKEIIGRYILVLYLF